MFVLLILFILPDREYLTCCEGGLGGLLGDLCREAHFLWKPFYYNIRFGIAEWSTQYRRQKSGPFRCEFEYKLANLGGCAKSKIYDLVNGGSGPRRFCSTVSKRSTSSRVLSLVIKWSL